VIDSSSIIVIVIAFLVGFFVVSKIFDSISGRRRITNQKYAPNSSTKNEEDLSSNNSANFQSSMIDKSALSILTLIGKFEPNPIDENFDKKLTIMQNFFDQNITNNKLARDQITKAIFYSKNSDMTLDMIIYKIKSLRQNDAEFYKKIIQLLLDISLVDGILSADEELTILKICMDFNITDSNPYKSYKDNLESKKGNSAQYFSQLDKDRYYGKVLGLVGQIKKEDIVKRYKELVIKYHPDKVSHLGEEFQLLAEIKIKEINSAFDYLKKRYNIN